MRLKGTLAAAVLLHAACGQESSDGPVGVIRTDSAGVEIVSNMRADAPLEIGVREVESLEGGGGTAFFRLQSHGLAVGPSGELLVLDQGNSRVAVFSEDLEWSHDLGRQGSGPGEFQYPSTLVVDDAGAVRVFDRGRRVEIALSMNGNVLSEERIVGGFSGGKVRMHDGAAFYERMLQEGIRWELTRDDAGRISTEVDVEIPRPASVQYMSCGLLMSLPPLFTQRPAWDANDEAVAFARADAYSVEVFSTDGTTRLIRRDIEPVEATEELAREHLGEGERWVVSITNECVVPPDEVIEQRGLAERLPLITELALSPEGELWVKRFRLGGDGVIDILSADGTYRGSLPGTSPWPDLFLSSERMATIEEDELGIERVVIYEIQR